MSKFLFLLFACSSLFCFHSLLVEFFLNSSKELSTKKMKPSLKVSDEDSKGDIVHAIRVLVVEGIQHTDEVRCKWIHSLLVKCLVPCEKTWKLHKEKLHHQDSSFFPFFSMIFCQIFLANWPIPSPKNVFVLKFSSILAK